MINNETTKDSLIEKNLNAIKFTFSELIKEARTIGHNKMSIRELKRRLICYTI